MSEASIPTTTPENESSMFQTKYDEFASELIDTFPELEKDILVEFREFLT